MRNTILAAAVRAAGLTVLAAPLAAAEPGWESGGYYPSKEHCQQTGHPAVLNSKGKYDYFVCQFESNPEQGAMFHLKLHLKAV